MKLHERFRPVDLARADLRAMIDKFAEERGLTSHELLRMLSDYMTTTLMYMIRDDRHPDPDCGRRGDEACGNPDCNEDEAGGPG